MIFAWTDGACESNPGPCAYGALIVQGETHHVLGKRLGEGTNNIAEYSGMIAVLQWLHDNAPDEPALIRTDSQLVAFRLNGTWKRQHSKHSHLNALIQQARKLLQRLPKVKIEWVRREYNVDADRIAAHALAGRLEPRQARKEQQDQA